MATGVIWIDENSDYGRSWHKIAKYIDLLLQKLSGEEGNASEIFAGPVQVSDKTKLHWVAAYNKYDGNCRGRLFGFVGWEPTKRSNDGHTALNKIVGKDL